METRPASPQPDRLESSGARGKHSLPSPLPLPPWDMYTVSVSLFSGYILIPLLVTNILMLTHPFLSQPLQMFTQQAVTLATWISIFAFLSWKYGTIRPYLGLVFSQPASYYVWETIKLVLLTTALTLGLSVLWMTLEKRMPGLHLEDKLPYADFSSAELAVLTLFAGFIQLILAQLQYQDPTNPQDNTQMLSQQLQLEQADQMKDIVNATKFSQAGSMVGKQATLVDAPWNFTTNTANPPEWDIQTNTAKTVSGTIEGVQFDATHGKALVKINGTYYDADTIQQLSLPINTNGTGGNAS